jgi:hypothetical protein
MSFLFIFTLFLTQIHSLEYTFLGNSEDFTDHINWNPVPLGPFTTEDDLIINISGTYELTEFISINNLLISGDITLTGNDISVNSIKGEETSTLVVDGEFYVNGVNEITLKSNNYDTQDLQGHALLP